MIEAEQFHATTMPLPFQGQGVCHLGDQGWHVHTLEGELHISDGDWIIKGVKGEFYPVKPDIFAALYDAVEG